MRRVVLVLLAAAAAATAGCGSSSGTQATTGGDAAREKAVRYATCMREHGVADFPDPDAHNEFSYGVSVSPAVYTKATRACRSLAPPSELKRRRTRPQQSVALKFAACMRRNGVKDFPDPVNGGPLIDTTQIPSANASGGMTILNAASDRCRALLEKALAGGR